MIVIGACASMTNEPSSPTTVNILSWLSLSPIVTQGELQPDFVGQFDVVSFVKEIDDGSVIDMQLKCRFGCRTGSTITLSRGLPTCSFSQTISFNNGAGVVDTLAGGALFPLVTFSINDVFVAEGNSGMSTLTFTVTKTGTGGASVNYVTGDGSATLANADYVALTTTTLVFPVNGMPTKTIVVTVNGDATCEPDETLNVLLSSPTNGAVILDSQGVGTITNDE